MKPLASMTDRELLEESTAELRRIRVMLDELEPLRSLARGLAAGGAPSYVTAAGVRRAMRRANGQTAGDRNPGGGG